MCITPTERGWRGFNLSQKKTIILNRDPNQIPLSMNDTISKLISYDKTAIYETDIFIGETNKKLDVGDLLLSRGFEDQIFLLFFKSGAAKC